MIMVIHLFSTTTFPDNQIHLMNQFAKSSIVIIITFFRIFEIDILDTFVGQKHIMLDGSSNKFSEKNQNNLNVKH